MADDVGFGIWVGFSVIDDRRIPSLGFPKLYFALFYLFFAAYTGICGDSAVGKLKPTGLDTSLVILSQKMGWASWMIR